MGKGKTIRRMAAFLLAALLLTLAAPEAGRAQAIQVGIGFSIPPYVIRETDSGVEVDVIREALRVVGFEAEFIYLPNLRLPIAFADGSVDCVAANSGYDLTADSGVQAHYSDITVVFQNFAVTLEHRGLRVGSIRDLAGKTVLGFNNAAKYLGEEFAAMAAVNETYSELADQALQVRMLYSGRVDAVISDKRIFLYWRKQLVDSRDAEAVSLDAHVVFHPIFSPSPRHVGFRDERLRTLFNQGLHILRANGALRAIEERYAGVEVE